MPVYSYSLVSGTASGSEATIEAPDRAAAVRELMRRGMTPVSVEPVSEGAQARGRSGIGGLVRRSVMSRSEMAQFIRELSTALQAGLPLVTALRTIDRMLRRQRQRQMMGALIDQLEHGKSLADAAASWGPPFTDLVVNLIRSGEASGRLAEVLAQASELLDRDVKLRRSLLGATLYPMILGSLVVIAIVVVVTVIVPRIVEPIRGQVLTLPLPTRILMGTAEVFGGYWWVILPVVLVVVVALRRAWSAPHSRRAIDEYLLRVPVLGRMLRDVAIARFTRTLGTLTSAGIAVVPALRVTKGTLGNLAMERVIDEVCEQVAAGRTIADPMEQSGYFPPMLVQIVNMGERSGRLDQMLNQAAGAFEERTETSIKLFTTALPPLLVVVMACVVGFVVVSIMLPLLEFQEALK